MITILSKLIDWRFWTTGLRKYVLYLFTLKTYNFFYDYLNIKTSTLLICYK